MMPGNQDNPASGQQAEDQPEPTLADRLSDEDQTYLLWSPDDRDEQLTLLIRQTVCDALFPEGLEGVVEVDDAAAKRMTDLLTGIDQAIADLDIPVNTGNLTLEEVEAAIQKVLDRIADAAELPADFELPEAPDVAEALQNVDTALSVLRTGFRLDTLRTTEITHEGALEALSGQSPFRAKEGPKPAAVFTEIPGEDPDPFWEELLSSVGVGGESTQIETQDTEPTRESQAAEILRTKNLLLRCKVLRYEDIIDGEAEFIPLMEERAESVIGIPSTKRNYGMLVNTYWEKFIEGLSKLPPAQTCTKFQESIQELAHNMLIPDPDEEEQSRSQDDQQRIRDAQKIIDAMADVFCKWVEQAVEKKSVTPHAVVPGAKTWEYTSHIIASFKPSLTILRKQATDWDNSETGMQSDITGIIQSVIDKPKRRAFQDGLRAIRAELTKGESAWREQHANTEIKDFATIERIYVDCYENMRRVIQDADTDLSPEDDHFLKEVCTTWLTLDLGSRFSQDCMNYGIAPDPIPNPPENVLLRSLVEPIQISPYTEEPAHESSERETEILNRVRTIPTYAVLSLDDLDGLEEELTRRVTEKIRPALERRLEGKTRGGAAGVDSIINDTGKPVTMYLRAAREIAIARQQCVLGIDDYLSCLREAGPQLSSVGKSLPQANKVFDDANFHQKEVEKALIEILPLFLQPNKPPYPSLPNAHIDPKKSFRDINTLVDDRRATMEEQFWQDRVEDLRLGCTSYIQVVVDPTDRRAYQDGLRSLIPVLQGASDQWNAQFKDTRLRSYEQMERVYTDNYELVRTIIQGTDAGLPDSQESHLKEICLVVARITFGKILAQHEVLHGLPNPDPKDPPENPLLAALVEPISVLRSSTETTPDVPSPLEDMKAIDPVRVMHVSALEAKKGDCVEYVWARVEAAVKAALLANNFVSELEFNNTYADESKKILEAEVGSIFSAIRLYEEGYLNWDEIMTIIDETIAIPCPEDVRGVAKARSAIRSGLRDGVCTWLRGIADNTDPSTSEIPGMTLSTSDKFIINSRAVGQPAEPHFNRKQWKLRNDTFHTECHRHIEATVQDADQKSRLISLATALVDKLQSDERTVSKVSMKYNTDNSADAERVWNDLYEAYCATVDGIDLDCTPAEETYIKNLCKTVIRLVVGQNLAQIIMLFQIPYATPGEIHSPLLQALADPVRIPPPSSAETIPSDPNSPLNRLRTFDPEKLLHFRDLRGKQDDCLNFVLGNCSQAVNKYMEAVEQLGTPGVDFRTNSAALRENITSMIASAFACISEEPTSVSPEKKRDAIVEQFNNGTVNMNDSGVQSAAAAKELNQKMASLILQWIASEFAAAPLATYCTLGNTKSEEPDNVIITLDPGEKINQSMDETHHNEPIQVVHDVCIEHINRITSDEQKTAARTAVSLLTRALKGTHAEASRIASKKINSATQVDTMCRSLLELYTKTISETELECSPAIAAFARELVTTGIHLMLGRRLAEHTVPFSDHEELMQDANSHPLLSVLTRPVRIKPLKEWEEELNKDPYDGLLTIANMKRIDRAQFDEIYAQWKRRVSEFGISEYVESGIEQAIKEAGEGTFDITHYVSSEARKLGSMKQEFSNGGVASITQLKKTQRYVECIADLLETCMSKANPVTPHALAEHATVDTGQDSMQVCFGEKGEPTRDEFAAFYASVVGYLKEGALNIPSVPRSKRPIVAQHVGTILDEFERATMRYLGRQQWPANTPEQFIEINVRTLSILRSNIDNADIGNSREAEAARNYCNINYVINAASNYLVGITSYPLLSPPAGTRPEQIPPLKELIDIAQERKGKAKEESQQHADTNLDPETAATLSREEALLNKPFLGKWWDKSMFACMQRCRFENLKSNRRPSPSEVLREPLGAVDTAVKNRISDLEDDPFIDQCAVDMFVGEVQDDIRETTIPEKTVFHGEEITLPRPQIRIFLSHKATELGEIVKPLLPEMVETDKQQPEEDLQPGTPPSKEGLGEGEASDRDEAEDSAAQATLAAEIAELLEQGNVIDSIDASLGRLEASIHQDRESAAERITELEDLARKGGPEGKKAAELRIQLLQGWAEYAALIEATMDSLNPSDPSLLSPEPDEH